MDNSMKHEVENIDAGVVYPDLVTASRSTGIPAATIFQCIWHHEHGTDHLMKFGKSRRSIFELYGRWRYTGTTTDRKKSETVDVTGKLKSKQKQGQKIICVTTGKAYKSIRQAHDDTGLPYCAISNSLRRGTPSQGLLFKRIQDDS